MTRILNRREFSTALTKAGQEAGEIALQFQKRLALEGLRRVVQRTPVDTGRARGGWQVAAIANDAAGGDPDPSGSSTVSAGLSIIDAITIPFGTIVIFNNVEYIVFLEEGSSQQAPQGMVALTIAELEQIVASAGFERFFRFTQR